VPRSSSISSSDPILPARSALRYLVLAAGTALMLVLAVCALNWHGFVSGLADFKEARLLRTQLDRLDAARDVDVVLLGDSSLANAVDDRAWRRESGRNVLALPLAGYFGYEGSLNMLRRVLRRGRPELVVVMQTIELAAREPAPHGTLLTAETWSDLEGVRPWHVVEHFASLDITGGILATLLRGGTAPRPAQDFVWQDDAMTPGEVRAEQLFLQPADLNEDKLAVLAHIGRLCREQGIRCVYAHGPYLDPACSAAQDYLEALDRRIRAAGLEVLDPTPLCFPLDQAGDQPDHVARALRPLFSEAYRRLVLGPAGGRVDMSSAS
jgi:hypothetical protein